MTQVTTVLVSSTHLICTKEKKKMASELEVEHLQKLSQLINTSESIQ